LYKGDEPERLYREAINCFDSLIEISHGNETIRDLAHRRGLDMKYLVDGASFVISKMHFNPENNYYITLGLPQHTTPEELSRRWKKFMLLYHPDKQVGNEEWVSERAKKVNEAYTTLKDETKRSEYDRRLTEQMLSRKFPSAPPQGAAHHRRPADSFRRHRSAETSEGWSRIRPYMTKVLVAVYILIALIMIGFIYMRNQSANLEAELAPEPARTQGIQGTQTASVTVPNTPAVEEHTTQTAAPESAEQKKEPGQLHQERANTTTTTSTLQTIRSWFRPNQKKPAQEKSQGKEDNTALPGKKVNGGQSNASSPIVPLSPPSAEQMQREDPPQQHAEVQKVLTEQRAEPARPLQELKKPALAQPKTEQITKEEVEEFMQRYVAAYTKNDLSTFLSLFSRSAVENNMTYNDIRNAYKETFSDKINHYRIMNMEIRTDGQTATVSGIYNINHYISAEDRWVKYSGKIAWKLTRENAQLRIISTNYDK